MVIGVRYPVCPKCGRGFAPGSQWFNANICRLIYLLPFVERHEGLSAAELAAESGMTYGHVSKALVKVRSSYPNLFRLESEERNQGGFRYRYYLQPAWGAVMEGLSQQHVRLMEPKP